MSDVFLALHLSGLALTAACEVAGWFRCGDHGPDDELPWAVELN